MRRFIVAVAAALLVSGFTGSVWAQLKPQTLPAPGEAPAGSPVAKHGALKVAKDASGKGVIQDKDGNAVVLRGMSFFWANAGEGYGSPYYSDAVVGWLAHDFRVSVVRAAIGADATEMGGKGYADGNAGGMLSAAETVVEACIRRGIYVIVDWHIHKDKYQSNAIEFFKAIGQKYGSYPNVLFEPFNEPLDVSWGNVKSYVNPIIAEIRKHSNNLVIVGNETWSQNPNNANNSGVTDSKNNTAYSFHFYTQTHSYGSMGNNVSSALNNGLAVFVTEFGTVKSDGDGEHNAGGTDSWLDALEGWKVSWVNWSVTHKPEGASILSSNGVGGGPGGAWNSLKTNGTYIKGKIVAKNDAAYSSWAKTYPITATVQGSGKVEKKVGNAINEGPYAYGDQVTITAVPNSGWQFEKWEGDATGYTASLSAYKVVGVPLSIKAVFVEGLLANGTFTTGITGWSFPDGGSLAYSSADATLKVTVSASPPANAHVRPANLALEHTKKYSLSFRAKAASGSGTITPRVTSTNGNTDYIQNPQAVSLTTEWKTTTVAFTMCSPTGAATTTAQLRFDCAAMAGKDWFIDDIVMKEDGTGQCSPSAVLPAVVKAQMTAWSIAQTGGALQLRGPAEAGAKVSLYDTRGKMIRSAAAKDGMALGVGVPAGNYIVVVKNRAGGEVLRSRVSMMK